MAPDSIRSFIAFCSPAGTTARVAATIESVLKNLSDPAESASICKTADQETVLKKISQASGKRLLLFVGSPVYGFHSLPPVMDFIRRLPSDQDIQGVPFVTWGGVCSGCALVEMGETLMKRTLRIPGAIKVPAEHSMSWAYSSPLCGGRPNEEDMAVIVAGIRSILQRVAEANCRSLTPSDLSAYTGDILENMRKGGFEAAKTRFPKIRFEESLCAACGQCAEVCPTACLTLDPMPRIGADCVMCYNCVKVCPEGALSADLSRSEAVIKERIQKLKEPQKPVVFRFIIETRT